MESKRVRLLSFIGALGLALGMFVPAQADTTGSVTVTGSIVASPLSMTIAQSSVAFGNIDAAGTPQQPTASATGLPTSGGAFWVADTAVTIVVSSPVPWTSQACHNNSGTRPPGGIVTVMQNKPATAQEAAGFYDSRRLPSDCASSPNWGVGNAGQVTRTVYLMTKVLETDSVSSFNTTVTFSVTPS